MASKAKKRPPKCAQYFDSAIEPLHLAGNESVQAMVDHVFASSGFNGRRLAEACQLYSRMLDENVTIALTVAGAMTPIGMSGPIIALIESGFADFIISTGANIYHDLHRPFGFPVSQGEFFVDDNELAKKDIVRIYDTFLSGRGTLLTTDRVIQEAVNGIEASQPLSTAELNRRIGLDIAGKAPHPEKSFLVLAAQNDVPVYCSAPGDSSIGMNMVVSHILGRPVRIDPIQDILETTAIIRFSEKNGAVEIGGGHPKNFYMQTQPTLSQILHDHSKKGHDYFIQLTTDAPHWGGLSGATPQEAKSWGKIKDATINNVVVYSCASITFPILCQYVLSTHKPRKPKRLMKRVAELAEELAARVRKNKRFQRFRV